MPSDPDEGVERPARPYDEVSTKTSGSTVTGPPPRARSRSWCTGASPAPAAKTIRRPGTGAAAGGVPGPPGGVQLARRSRRPAPTRPGSRPGGRRGTGPGWTNTGLPATSATPEHGAERAPTPAGRQQRRSPAAAGPTNGRRPAARRARRGPGSTDGHRGPGGGSGRAARGRRVPGRRSAAPASGRGQLLDAERRGQARTTGPMPSSGTPRASVVVRPGRRRTAARRRCAASSRAGTAGAVRRRSRVDEPLGPQVLVHVECGAVPAPHLIWLIVSADAFK